MIKDIEPFISLVIPEAVLGDNRLTFLERVLLIEIVSLCKKMDIVGLLTDILWINLIVLSLQYQRV